MREACAKIAIIAPGLGRVDAAPAALGGYPGDLFHVVGLLRGTARGGTGGSVGAGGDGAARAGSGQVSVP